MRRDKAVGAGGWKVEGLMAVGWVVEGLLAGGPVVEGFTAGGCGGWACDPRHTHPAHTPRRAHICTPFCPT
eukprot:19720-Chlamydomonas_euryale.AAC.1